jgi:saccharopine dehydrogenase (NAD+, L-lysine-forming)
MEEFDKTAERKLAVICDVSCDATNLNNPIPVYWGSTTFDDPLVRVMEKYFKYPIILDHFFYRSKLPIDVIAIDHLPTLLPRESSEFFGTDLLESLIALQNYENARVWNRAEDLYWGKVGEC